MSIPASMLPANVTLGRAHLPEGERRELLRSLRRQIAAREVTEARYRELVDQLEKINAELDESAAEHIERCRPIQERLQAIESQQVEDAADRKPKNEKLERERLSLIAQLDQANTELALVVERLNAKKTAVAREQHALVFKTSGEPSVAALESRVVRECGKPELVDELLTVSIDTWFRGQQCEMLAKLEASHKRPGSEEAARKLGLALAAAAAEHAGLINEAARLTREIINE